MRDIHEWHNRTCFLQSDWTADHSILKYSIYTVNQQMMEQWNKDVLTALRHWDNSKQPRLLFDLTHPNVSMSYYVMCHRELYNVGITPDGKDYFLKYLDSNPSVKVKLAVVLSNTLLSALSKRLPPDYKKPNFSARIFFKHDAAEQWLRVEPGEESMNTGRISSNTVLRAIHAIDFDTKDIYGNRDYLRLMVNGSPEEIPIIKGRPVIVGRTPRADLDLSGFGEIARSVSRRHAQISLSNGRLTIIDLESRNGTYVSGHKIEPGKAIFIRRDDTIRVGNIEFSILF